MPSTSIYYAAVVMQDREAGEDEQQYSLTRFVPLLQEVIEDLASSSLSTDDYPYVSTPTPDGAAPFLDS